MVEIPDEFSSEVDAWKLVGDSVGYEDSGEVSLPGVVVGSELARRLSQLAHHPEDGHTRDYIEQLAEAARTLWPGADSQKTQVALFIVGVLAEGVLKEEGGPPDLPPLLARHDFEPDSEAEAVIERIGGLLYHGVVDEADGVLQRYLRSRRQWEQDLDEIIFDDAMSSVVTTMCEVVQDSFELQQLAMLGRHDPRADLN